MHYFKNITTLSELKKQFRNLCMRLHPDIGGTKEEFQNMQSEYEQVLDNILTGKTGNCEFTQQRQNYERYADKQMRNIINKIIHLPDIHIEIIGSWLWVSGNTYPHKDILKQNGLFFARKKVAWYWRAATYKKTSKKHFELNELRNLYGYKKVETKDSEKHLTE